MHNLTSWIDTENIILFISGSYLVVRLCQKVFQLVKNHYSQYYHPLKQARQYKNNPEIYRYHLFSYARRLFHRQKISKSKKYLESILKEEPDYPQANYFMGMALFNQHKFLEATRFFEKEAAIDSDNPLIFYFLSMSYFKLNEFDKALSVLNKSLNLNPYQYSAYFLALDIFSKLKVDPEEEWNFFYKAEEFKCLTRPVWIHMANLEKHFLTLDKQRERSEFYHSVEKNWIESSLLKQKALHAIGSDDLDEAENLIKKSIKINPHDNQLYQLYDQILVAQQKFSKVLEFYSREFKRIITNPFESTLRIVDYLVYNQRYKEALEKMLNLYNKYPNIQILNYPISVLYNLLGDTEKALEYLNKAIYFDRDIISMAVKNPQLKNIIKNNGFKNVT